ncbi:MAG: LysR family transcriptional regulator [Gammaproteobacteria bacterium]|nr:LysR family transcriptional regulator [Gammaproteobacteria bacterium]
MDKLTRIKVYVNVVETGSFTAASERMGISRAAASQYVAQLEEHLGGRLLNRTTRHVSTTEAGRMYFARCKDILHHLEEADNMVSGFSGTPKGTLRISAPSVFAERHLVPIIYDFTKAYPDVKIDLMVTDRYVDMVYEAYDLAIRVTKIEDSDLVARRLASCRHILAASPAYLKSSPLLSSPDDLKNHACLLYSYTTGAVWPLFKNAKDYSVKVSPVMTSNNPEVLLEAAINGMGITIMPTFIASDAIRRGDLLTVLDDYESLNLDIYAIYSSRHYLPAKIRFFVDFLKEKINDPPYWDDFKP